MKILPQKLLNPNASWSFATPLHWHCIGGLTMSPEKMNAINHRIIQTSGIIFPLNFVCEKYTEFLKSCLVGRSF